MQLLDLQISDYTPILNKNQNSGQQRTKTKLKYTANKRHQLTIDMHLETVTSKRGKKWETSTSSCESLGGSDLLAEAAGEDFDAIAGRVQIRTQVSTGDPDRDPNHAVTGNAVTNKKKGKVRWRIYERRIWRVVLKP